MPLACKRFFRSHFPAIECNLPVALCFLNCSGGTHGDQKEEHAQVQQICRGRREARDARVKRGKLKSGGSGKKVTSRKQAIAIGLSEARKEGKKVPKKKAS